MSDFNEAVEMALRTWYPKDHPLHLNPHHPLGKLLGEWGELLDDYMKSLYKPCYKFKPLNELGDIWYYLRILCYQGGSYYPKPYFISSNSIDYLIAFAMNETSMSFLNSEDNKGFFVPLDTNYSVLVRICELQNITLQQLTDSNWEKLKPGSERGEQWMQARASTEYVGGKVAKK
jgi:hypothetical protein